jgi:cell wall-associated NlpC family hydrolase
VSVAYIDDFRSTQPSHETDLDVQTIVLDVVSRKVRGLDARITASITGGELERTIEGASTLTLSVHDPERALLRSGMFSRAIDVRLDRLYFRLVKVAKSDDDLTLTFEDREVAYLRTHTKPKKAARSKMTRAEFALSLVREVKAGGGIRFVSPELHVRQPITGQRKKRSSAGRARERQKGLSSAARHLTVKGKAASATQKRYAERVLDVADSLNAPTKAAQALVAACIVESRIHNLSGGDRDSRGILQVRDSTARPMRLNNRDVEACASAFLTRGYWGKGGAIALARKHPSWTLGQIAQAVQGSGYPSRYDEHGGEARKFVDAYGSGDVTGSGDVRRKVPYQFRRGGAGTTGREDSWTCLQRLAEEVRWRCFMSAGALYFISEDQLLKAKPRLVLSEQTDGVLGIDFDVDNGKVSSEVTVTARARRWIAAPGAVVQLSDCGPADGRWLVATIHRGLFDATATITLKRRTKKLREPEAETEADQPQGRASRGSAYATFGSSGGNDEKAVDVYQAARAIHAKRYPYVWGGGHARAGVADRGTGRDPGIGFDCSGAVSAVLAAAGLGFKTGRPGADSTKIARTWGRPGRGRLFTVYSNPSHVFIVFHTRQGDSHWGTGDWGKGWGGAGFNPRMHPLSGFTVRHWPGL